MDPNGCLEPNRSVARIVHIAIRNKKLGMVVAAAVPWNFYNMSSLDESSMELTGTERTTRGELVY